MLDFRNFCFAVTTILKIIQFKRVEPEEADKEPTSKVSFSFSSVQQLSLLLKVEKENNLIFSCYIQREARS